MSMLSEIMGRLGTAAGNAASVALTWDDIERERKAIQAQRDHQMKVQSRQLASQDFDIIQKQALATKDPAQLAALANQGTQVLRGGGFNVPNQKIVGGMALLPQPRPTPDMQGPMPLTKQQTFDTPQTKAAARGMLLLPQPKTEYKVVDHGNGGAGYWTQAPDAAPVYTETRKASLKTPSIRYEDDEVQEDGTIVRKRPVKSVKPKAAPKGPRRTKVEVKGDRKITTDLDTGAILKDEPAKAPTKPKEAKPFDEAKAVRDAKTVHPDPSGMEKLTGVVSPEIQRKRDAFVRKKQAEHAKGGGKKPLEQRLKDMGLL